MKKMMCAFLVCSMVLVTACGGKEESAVGMVVSEQISSEIEEKVVEKTEITTEKETVVIEEEKTEEEAPVEVGQEIVQEPEVVDVIVPEEESVESTEETATGAVAIRDRQIDVDLTKLSAIMVYAEVYSIVSNPEAYDGLVIKMNGPCFTYENPETGDTFYAVIIQDATACCTQGLEFILGDGAVKPYDYPPVDEIITVVGEIEIFEEYGFTFCRIKDGIVL